MINLNAFVSALKSTWIRRLLSVIHLQFWACGFWDLLIPISMSPTANL